jgi:hypothetical protein
MPGGFTISETLVQTFRDAVEAVAALWRGGPEAALLHDGKPVSIRYVIEIVSIFEDRMPDDLYARLCEIADDGEGPADCTFAAGAWCLRGLYGDIRARRRAAAGNARPHHADLF